MKALVSLAVCIRQESVIDGDSAVVREVAKSEVHLNEGGGQGHELAAARGRREDVLLVAMVLCVCVCVSFVRVRERPLATAVGGLTHQHHVMAVDCAASTTALICVTAEPRVV